MLRESILAVAMVVLPTYALAQGAGVQSSEPRSGLQSGEPRSGLQSGEPRSGLRGGEPQSSAGGGAGSGAGGGAQGGPPISTEVPKSPAPASRPGG